MATDASARVSGVQNDGAVGSPQTPSGDTEKEPPVVKGAEGA